MKKYTFILSLLSFIFFSEVTFGQDFEVPPQYEFASKEDYGKYHEQVIAAAKWLENTPINQEKEKRKKVNAFLFQWISGSPDVSVELQQYVSTFSDKNPQLLLVFLGGWARYQLQHPAEKDTLKFHTAGIESMLRAYEQGGAKRDKGVEKLLKYKEKEKLDDWIRKKAG